MALRRWTVLLGVCVLGLIRPPAASAGLLGWLEQLSGPGPWHGEVYGATIVCVSARPNTPGMQEDEKERTKTKSFWCSFDQEHTLFFIDVEVGKWRQGPRETYDGTVNLRTYQLMIYKPLRNVFCPNYLKPLAKAMEVGTGVGLYRFSGGALTASEQYHFDIPLRLHLVPWELLPDQYLTPEKHRRLRLIMDSIYIAAGFDIVPGTFNNFARTDGTRPVVGGEALKTAALMVDGGRLVRGIFGPH